MSGQTPHKNASHKEHATKAADAIPKKGEAHKAQPKKESRSAEFRQRVLANAGKEGEPKWLVRRFFRKLAAVVLFPLFRVRVTGSENIPSGPCLLSPNHTSYADGLIIFALAKRLGMPLRILAKRELWKLKPLGWVLDHVGVMPISRDKADLDTLRTASRVIKAGDSMAIFPEGTRVRNGQPDVHNNQALGEAHGGAAWLALRNDVPVIPVAIVGAENIRPDGVKLIRFPRVLVHFGTPLFPDEVVPSSEYTRKERVTKLTELIMEGLSESLEVARAENALPGRARQNQG